MSLSNCRIDTSDDSITLRASGAGLLEHPQDCAFVSITNCHLSSSCNAIRIGVGEGHIHDAVISNVTISDTNVAFNFVGSYVKDCRGTDIDGILLSQIRVQAQELLRIHHMHAQAAVIKDITLDGITGTAPNTSRIWAREAAPFEGIILRDVDVPAQFECIHAEVRVTGGLLREKVLSDEERALRRENIENGKKLLY